MFKFLKSAVRTHFDGYTATGKFWLSLAIFALVVDAAISYQYGITLTTLHGIGFALVAVFFALLPDAAYSEIESKRVASGLVLGALCVPLGIVAFYSHLGYGAGVRMGDMQQTGVQNTKFEDKRGILADKKRELANWEKTAAELVEANGWATTTTAVALRTQLEVAQKDIDLEAKRGGCKAKCRERMKEKADLESRIAIAEKREDLSKNIAAATRKVEDLTREVAEATYASSSVVNQNNVAAQLWLAFTGAKPSDAISPDAVTASFTSIIIAGGGSLAFMIMAPVGFFVAGRNRKSASELTRARVETMASSVGHTTNTVIQKLDDTRAAQAIRDAINASYARA